MQVDAVHHIVGDIPDFMVMAMLRDLATKWFDPEGGWTHLADPDEADIEILEKMVQYGIADCAQTMSDGVLIDLHRWHQEIEP